MSRKISAVACALVALCLPTLSHAKTARCVLTDGQGKKTYDAPCKFSVEKGGSFSVEPMAPKTEMDGASVVNVDLTGPGEAEVSGLVDDKSGGGNTSRWGSAKRSAKDRACWVGEDFQICVY